MFILEIEYPAKKRKKKKTRRPKPWCNDSGALNLHHGYYTSIMTSRWLFRHNLVLRGTNQKTRKSDLVHSESKLNIN